MYVFFLWGNGVEHAFCSLKAMPGKRLYSAIWHLTDCIAEHKLQAFAFAFNIFPAIVTCEAFQVKHSYRLSNVPSACGSMVVLYVCLLFMAELMAIS